ncbi:MAG: hypothetical protein PHE55_05665 [Methylococcaceae bacterium]|nr:hypothetical protein [Methylococcaceae bacterium]
MSHSHGAAASAAHIGKQAVNGTVKAMEQSMMNHAPVGAAKAMEHGLTHQVVPAAVGVAAAGATAGGRSLLGKLFHHPLVLFGLGFAVGYTLHKYRKEIIETANRAAEQGKDFALQQRENLEDLVAESRKTED